MKHFLARGWMWGIFAGVAALAACGGSLQPVDQTESIGQVVPVDGFGSYVDILPSELDAMLESGDFFFVNVHIPNEGEIPGTDTDIPFDKVVERLDEFPRQKDARIVVYCRSGSMSTIAARALVEAGYTNVLNLDGGFRAWVAAGFPFNP